MKHPLQEMMDKRRQGIRCGIPSYCSANELVIEIALRRAKERSIPVLIEATANQVNQFGGYTGMKPADFYQMVLKMAKDIDLPENMMILAGDHLGPLTWQKLPEAEAMKNSVELVYQYARAGFTKIHLDTSMKVADDAPGLLKTEVIARRGAQLYKAAMKGYEELKAEKPDAMRPVFVIGSEVPIPGVPRRPRIRWLSPAPMPSATRSLPTARLDRRGRGRRHEGRHRRGRPARRRVRRRAGVRL